MPGMWESSWRLGEKRECRIGARQRQPRRAPASQMGRVRRSRILPVSLLRFARGQVCRVWCGREPTSHPGLHMRSAPAPSRHRKGVMWAVLFSPHITPGVSGVHRFQRECKEPEEPPALRPGRHPSRGRSASSGQRSGRHLAPARGPHPRGRRRHPATAAGQRRQQRRGKAHRKHHHRQPRPHRRPH